MILRSSKTIKYSGKEINDREFAGNNLDYAGSNLLYNKDLSKETNVGMLLRNMNATVFATNDNIHSLRISCQTKRCTTIPELTPPVSPT